MNLQESGIIVQYIYIYICIYNNCCTYYLLDSGAVFDMKEEAYQESQVVNYTFQELNSQHKMQLLIFVRAPWQRHEQLGGILGRGNKD